MNIEKKKPKPAEILENKKVGTDYYLMKLKTDNIDEKWTPGRFVHLKISTPQTYDPLLRRPFSLFDIDRKNNILSLLYCVVGRGTKIMSRLVSGEKLDFLGPLGQGFSLPEGKTILAVGGGMGTAPLFLLCRELAFQNSITLILGGNLCTDVEFFKHRFGELDIDIKIATMDGSCGYKGTAVDLMKKHLGVNKDSISKEPTSEQTISKNLNNKRTNDKKPNNKRTNNKQPNKKESNQKEKNNKESGSKEPNREESIIQEKKVKDAGFIEQKKKLDFLYTCGPEIMLSAVKKISDHFGIPGEVSLEERMGCGIGICLSCVCDTQNGNQRVCKEGPIFRLQEVIL